MTDAQQQPAIIEEEAESHDDVWSTALGEGLSWATPMPGENTAWHTRFAKYCVLGPARSVRSVYRAERDLAQSTSVPGTWTKATKRFEWQRRATEYDGWIRDNVFRVGNASDLVRVKKLDLIAEKMYSRLVAELDTMPVNDKFLAQFIAVLDMLAKHTGGYAAQRIEHTGKDGGKIEVEETQNNVYWYMPKIDELGDDPTLGDVSPGGGAKQINGDIG